VCGKETKPLTGDPKEEEKEEEKEGRKEGKRVRIGGI